MGLGVDTGNKRKMLVIAIIGVILVASVGVLVYSLGQGSEPSGVSITDAMGRNVVLNGVPERIVSCQPSTTETVYALGFGSKLVGVSKNCDSPSEVSDRKESGDLKDVGSYSKPTLEAVAACEPDLVILDSSVAGQAALLPQLETLNITVLMIYKPVTIDNIYDNLRLIGKAFQNTEVAEEVVASIADKISEVQETIADYEKTVTAAYILGFYGNGITVAGGNTFPTSSIALAGGSSVFANLEQWPQIDVGYLADMNPNVIFLTSTLDEKSAEEMLTYFDETPIWQDLDAVKNDKVYILEGRAANIFSRPSVTIAECVELLAMMCYPDAFDKTLPNIIGNEYKEYLE